MTQLFKGEQETREQYHARMAPVHEALRAAGLNPIDVLLGEDPQERDFDREIARRDREDQDRADRHSFEQENHRTVVDETSRPHRPITGPTEKQLAFIAKLAAERGVAVPTVATKKQASAEIERLLAAPKAAQPKAEPRTSSPYPKVAAGHYATASRTGNNDLDFWRVDRPTEGKWAGYTFVKRIIGGHPDSPVRGSEAKRALEAILAAGEKTAAVLYAHEVGRCSRCNRSLTDQVSRDRGLGPECASKE